MRFKQQGPHRVSTVVTRDRHEMPRSIPLVELWPARDAVEDSTVVGGRIPLLTTFPVKERKGMRIHLNTSHSRCSSRVTNPLDPLYVL